MSVLNKLSRQERKTLNRCLKDKVDKYIIDKSVPNKKIISFCFCEPISKFRVAKRFNSSLTYFASKERIKNKTFKILVSFKLPPYREGEEIKPFLSVLCEEDGLKLSFFRLAILSKILSERRFAGIIFIFKDGDFEDDEPLNINNGRIFTYDNCVACLEEEPKVHFVDCGHICLCEYCDLRAMTTICPVCLTDNNIKRLV